MVALKIKHFDVKKNSGRSEGAWIARRVTIGQLMACLTIVMMMLVVNIYFEKNAVAKRSLDFLAQDYYRNYFYDKFVDGRVASEKIFAPYADEGFPLVTLRQLLNADGAKHANRKWDFEHCDKIATTAKFRPVAPFGKDNFEMELHIDCD